MNHLLWELAGATIGNRTFGSDRNYGFGYGYGHGDGCGFGYDNNMNGSVIGNGEFEYGEIEQKEVYDE